MKDIKEVKEPWHWPEYRIEAIKSKNKYTKRTFCDTCGTFWDVEYKKLK
jgi:hypothetical protein